MARLHAETASDLDGYGQFHVDADGGVATAGHGDWQAGAVEYVRNYRGTLERHGHGDVLDTVLDALAGHPHLFDGVGTAVCCHGWATPEHVAVEEGQVSCMVDFEHAVAAPGEFDYWRTVFPALGGEENEDARRAFRTGYESVRALPDGLARRRPLYRLLNGVYFFESLYVQSQHDPAETERRAASLRETVDGIVTGLGEG